MSSNQPANSATKQPSRKSTVSADELTKTPRGGIELTEGELGRVAGGADGHKLK